ncbi:MAG: helix-turn-helix domain-containing protein [Dysosmobacter sp.]|nr:helix-turn-helix domain-containing protein [Dysosmobacter sp.]
MEMHDRIRELRKNYLHMSQAAFGSKLGVNRDVINNIENNRLAKPEQKLSLIKLMCREFSVNEEWLLNGTEPMIAQPETFSLDQYLKERGCTALEMEIVKAYFELDMDTRQKVFDHFQARLSAAKEQLTAAADAGQQQEIKSPQEMTVAELHAELDRQIAEEKKRAAGQSVSGPGRSEKVTG